jgi:hypothetical protein
MQFMTSPNQRSDSCDEMALMRKAERGARRAPLQRHAPAIKKNHSSDSCESLNLLPQRNKNQAFYSFNEIFFLNLQS